MSIDNNSEIYKDKIDENYFINVALNTFMLVVKSVYYANRSISTNQQVNLSTEAASRVNDFYEDMAGTEASLLVMFLLLVKQQIT